MIFQKCWHALGSSHESACLHCNSISPSYWQSMVSRTSAEPRPTAHDFWAESPMKNSPGQVYAALGKSSMKTGHAESVLEAWLVADQRKTVPLPTVSSKFITALVPFEGIPVAVMT